MADYSFITHWFFSVPIEEVWDELYHTSRWPSWWKAVVSVEELSKGDELGVGGVKLFTWRTALPYTLSFEMKATRIEPPHIIEGEAYGELDGYGRWTLTERDGGTAVQYEWNVKATKPWMRILSPIARPAFQWNHDVVMRWGEESLKKRLEGKKLDASQ